MRRVNGVIGGLGLALAMVMGCPDDNEGGTTGNVTTNNASSPSSVSNEDGPVPVMCVDVGGVCSCVGSCEPGTTPAGGADCPQPPDESGACSQECCVPDTSTAGSTVGTTAGSADTTAPPVCDCAALPVCNTPDGEDCNGQYPDGHCCDEEGAAMTCSCIDPCDGGFPCCFLNPGCE